MTEFYICRNCGECLEWDGQKYHKARWIGFLTEGGLDARLKTISNCGCTGKAEVPYEKP